MDYNIGILGGCMMCQPGLKLSELFFRQFSHQLKETLSVTPRMSFGFYKEFSKVPIIADQLFEKEELDLLIFQVRPGIYLARSEFIISDNKGKYILNPLIRNTNNFAALETIMEVKNPITDPINNYKTWEKKGIWQLKKNNLQLGHVFFLSKRAILNTLQLIDGLHNKCKKSNTNLIVISPIPRKMANKNQNLSALNNVLIKKLSLTNIPYVDIFSTIENDVDRYLTDDCIHLNRDGHNLLAEQIFISFQEHIVKSI